MSSFGAAFAAIGSPSAAAAADRCGRAERLPGAAAVPSSGTAWAQPSRRANSASAHHAPAARPKPWRPAAATAPASIPAVPAPGARTGPARHPRPPRAGAELPKLARQTADRLAVGSVAELLQHRGEVLLRQEVFRRPYRQPAAAKQHEASRAGICRFGRKIAGAREQHGIAQGRLVLDAAGLLRARSGCRQRQPLPPRAGPFFFPTHDRVERAEGGARGDGDILKGFRGKGLRIGHPPAQPARNRHSWDGWDGAGERTMMARRGFGPKNHRWQNESSRRF